jgi:hypothetical protein
LEQKSLNQKKSAILF